MIFCGDIALSRSNVINCDNIPLELRRKFWFGNLEGSLFQVEDSNLAQELSKSGVFNSYIAIKDLLSVLNLKGVSIANNHILDRSNIKDTILLLNRLNVGYVGAGNNYLEASIPLYLSDENDDNFVVLAFGWECISCIYATKNKQGVNPYDRDKVLSQVNEVLRKKNKIKVICYFHWNYELELYPQPYDRNLAHELIDLGVYAVIGCHAHRPQNIEFYKGKPIVYGLGNFLFVQKCYFDGKLEFPDCATEEYAFEIRREKFVLHRFIYDKDGNALKYLGEYIIDNINENFIGKAIFTGYSNDEYAKFFSKSRVKNKLLPIFMANESKFVCRCKIKWVKMRDLMINLILKIGLKSAKR